MRKIYFLFIVLLFSNIMMAQNQKVIDSLSQKLLNTKIDSIKVALYNDIAFEYKSSNPDSAIYLSNKALALSNKRYSIKEIDIYNTIAITNYLKKDYQAAIDNWEKAASLAREIGVKNRIAKFESNIGIMYKNMSMFEVALEKYMIALAIEKENLNYKGQISVLHNLSNLYYRLEKFEEGIEFAEEGIRISRNHNQYNLHELLNSLGILYYFTNQFEKSIDVLKEAIVVNTKINDSNRLAMNYQNIANTYFEWKKYDKANEFYLKTIEIKEKIDDETSLARTYFALGKTQYKQGNFVKSIVNIEKAKKVFDNTGLIDEKYTIYDQLAKIYFDNKEFKKAYEASLSANTLNDSLSILNNESIIEELNTKYQTQQKENEILQLTNENIKKEASLTQSRYVTYGAIGILLFVLGFGYIIWNKRKQQHKLALLKTTVKTSEDEKARIGKELHDGIASKLMKLVRDSETHQIELSHQLLETYNEVRTLSHQLDNTPMHNELFFERVMDIIPEHDNNGEFNFSISPRNLEIKEPYGTHVFRIVQELVTNNLKYAQATKTDIDVVLDKGKLRINYSDDGKGAEKLKKGNGHKNIDYRVILMHGKMELQTNNGFKVDIVIPYDEAG